MVRVVDKIIQNARRYVMLFCDVVDEIMPPPEDDIRDSDEVIDVILHQRQERNRQLGLSQEQFPTHLLRR